MVRTLILMAPLAWFAYAQTPANDLCSNALPLGQYVTGTLVGAGPTASIPTPPFCVNTGLTAVDVWYVYTPAQTGTVTLNASITSGPSIGQSAGVVLYSGSCGALAIVPIQTTCTVTNCLVTAGTTYFARVSLASGIFGPGEFVMTMQFVLYQCQANGLTLGFSGERLGDPFTLTLDGSPGSAGLLGIDTASGPVPTPIGPVCLGLTPALQLLPFALDSSGHFGLGGLLPLQQSLVGLSAYLQAAAVDPGQPTGSALSNSASALLRPPRIFFVDPGWLPSNLPSGWCAYDAMNDSVFLGPITMFGQVIDVAHIKAIDWLAFLLLDSASNTTLACYDARTGAPTLSIPFGATSPPSALAVEGSTLHLVYPGSAFAGLPSVPGGTRALSLPSGTAGPFVQLASGNPDAMLVLPGAGIAYLRTGTTICRVDLVNGVELSPLALGGTTSVTEWLLVGTTLYCLESGIPGIGISAALDAIDTTTHTILFPAPVPLFTGLSGAGSLLRYGPGPSGNCLHVYNGYVISQIDPVTLVPFNSVATSNWLTEMTLSSGGTEWLLLHNPSPIFGAPFLQRLQPPSLTVSTITPLLYHMQLLVAPPSATMRRAFTVFGTHEVLPFDTDPAMIPASSVTLPFPIGSPGTYGLRALVD